MATQAKTPSGQGKESRSTVFRSALASVLRSVPQASVASVPGQGSSPDRQLHFDDGSVGYAPSGTNTSGRTTVKTTLTFLASPGAAGDTLPLSANTFTCPKCLLKRQSGAQCHRCGFQLPKYRTCGVCHATAKGAFCNACGAPEEKSKAATQGIGQAKSDTAADEKSGTRDVSNRSQESQASDWSDVEEAWAKRASSGSRSRGTR